MVRPGVTYGEVYEASQQAIRDAGYPEFVERAQSFRWTSIGHNIGLDLHEMPGIAKDNAAVLQPNQVICIEPFFLPRRWFPGLGPCRTSTAARTRYSSQRRGTRCCRRTTL